MCVCVDTCKGCEGIDAQCMYEGGNYQNDAKVLVKMNTRVLGPVAHGSAHHHRRRTVGMVGNDPVMTLDAFSSLSFFLSIFLTLKKPMRRLCRQY